jgi:hypothetical protein
MRAMKSLAKNGAVNLATQLDCLKLTVHQVKHAPIGRITTLKSASIYKSNPHGRKTAYRK